MYSWLSSSATVARLCRRMMFGRVILFIQFLTMALGEEVDDTPPCYTTGRRYSSHLVLSYWLDSMSRPSFPKAGLQFCSMFRSNACCDPAIDAEIQGYYEELLYVSDLCASTRTQAHIALQYIFCFGCHPKQWKYTNTTSQVIRLCPSLATLADPVNFDDCGINLLGERGDLCSGSDPVSSSWSELFPSFHFLWHRRFRVFNILMIQWKEWNSSLMIPVAECHLILKTLRLKSVIQRMMNVCPIVINMILAIVLNYLPICWFYRPSSSFLWSLPSSCK